MPSQVATDVVSWTPGKVESERNREPDMAPENRFKNQERKKLKEAPRQEELKQQTASSQNPRTKKRKEKKNVHSRRTKKS